MNRFRRIVLALTAMTLSIGSGFWIFSVFRLSSGGAMTSNVRLVEANYHGNSAGNIQKDEIFKRKDVSTLQTSAKADFINMSSAIKQHKPLPSALKDLTVIYYMVPKCGSRTFFYLMGELKKTNPNLQDVVALTSAETEVRNERTKDVPKFVAEAKKPAFLYVDTHFVNMKNTRNVMYISIVRDPLERYLSQFSFHIAGDNMTAPQTDREWVKTKQSALDQCVEQERQICSGRWLGRAMHSRFCGTGIVCYQTCRKNFLQGKRNMLQKYNVVGMLEKFEDFLLVLERLVPSIFEGILDLYRLPATKEFMAKVKTAEKVKPSEETLQKLKGFLQRDFEFYQAVKTKFHKLKQQLGI